MTSFTSGSMQRSFGLSEICMFATSGEGTTVSFFSSGDGLATCHGVLATAKCEHVPNVSKVWTCFCLSVRHFYETECVVIYHTWEFTVFF